VMEATLPSRKENGSDVMVDGRDSRYWWREAIETVSSEPNDSLWPGGQWLAWQFWAGAKRPQSRCLGDVGIEVEDDLAGTMTRGGGGVL
jgi:hypothetical protein